MARQIGVRELRQAASEHLRAVSAGDEIVVTDRGRPVAKLVPTSPAERALAQAVAAYSLSPPARPRRRFSATPRLPGPSLSDDITAERADRELFTG